jgi:hypothetical protein
LNPKKYEKAKVQNIRTTNLKLKNANIVKGSTKNDE